MLEFSIVKVLSANHLSYKFKKCYRDLSPETIYIADFLEQNNLDGLVLSSEYSRDLGLFPVKVLAELICNFNLSVVAEGTPVEDDEPLDDQFVRITISKSPYCNPSLQVVTYDPDYFYIDYLDDEDYLLDLECMYGIDDYVYEFSQTGESAVIFVDEDRNMIAVTIPE